MIEEYQFRTIGKEIDEITQQWPTALTEAQILAMNCISPLAEKGCGHFELCEACLKKGYCIDCVAKNFLDKYWEKALK